MTGRKQKKTITVSHHHGGNQLSIKSERFNAVVVVFPEFYTDRDYVEVRSKNHEVLAKAKGLDEMRDFVASWFIEANGFTAEEIKAAHDAVDLP